VSARYPVMLDVSRWSVLVVGGGEVALRKVRGLLEAGARPDIIAPDVHPELRALIGEHGLEWRQRGFEDGDAAAHRLVFAATDSAEVNERVRREAEEGGRLANVADDSGGSTVHVPATIRAGDVTVAFSTGGASPLLARRLRERLESVVTPGLGRAANRLAAARTEVRARWPEDESRRRAAWHDLITPDFLDAAIAGRDHEVELRIARCLSQS
jgi:siroheme synthase-like protein